MADDAPPGAPSETVESVSALYLGNILYALERCAIALEEEGHERLANSAFSNSSRSIDTRCAVNTRR